MVGLPEALQDTPSAQMRRQMRVAQSRLTISDTEAGKVLIDGSIYQRNGIGQFGLPLNVPGGGNLARYEGLIIRIRGDGKPYCACLKMEDGSIYETRFNTRKGWQTVRLPFTSFLSPQPESGEMDPSKISALSLRFETRKVKSDDNTLGSANQFAIEIDYIKALPSNPEPAFILVSCTGGGMDLDEEDKSKALGYKRMGEQVLRNSGLSYTIVRPGRLLDEPGGQRALVFDQGDRITQGIASADVADVCLKALHENNAVNKSFEVCHEYSASGSESALYELVAHVPDKSTSYLSPALSVLEKNT